MVQKQIHHFFLGISAYKTIDCRYFRIYQKIIAFINICLGKVLRILAYHFLIDLFILQFLFLFFSCFFIIIIIYIVFKKIFRCFCFVTLEFENCTLYNLLKFCFSRIYREINLILQKLLTILKFCSKFENF